MRLFAHYRRGLQSWARGAIIGYYGSRGLFRVPRYPETQRRPAGLPAVPRRLKSSAKFLTRLVASGGVKIVEIGRFENRCIRGRAPGKRRCASPWLQKKNDGRRYFDGSRGKKMAVL